MGDLRLHKQQTGYSLQLLEAGEPDQGRWSFTVESASDVPNNTMPMVIL